MKILYLATAFALCANSAIAISAPITDYKPTAMLGVSFAFGSGKSAVGFTAKVLSSNEQDKAALAAGVTYYPWAESQFGFDFGLGVISGSTAATFTYDFLQKAPQFSLGHANGYTAPARNY